MYVGSAYLPIDWYRDGELKTDISSNVNWIDPSDVTVAVAVEQNLEARMIGTTSDLALQVMIIS